MINTLLNECTDLHVLATLGRAELLHTGDFIAKSNATCAVNAACHIGGYQRADIFIFHDALAVLIARNVTAITDSEILQFTLDALIANRAIQGVIDQQKFHGRFLRGYGFR